MLKYVLVLLRGFGLEQFDLHRMFDVALIHCLYMTVVLLQDQSKHSIRYLIARNKKANRVGGGISTVVPVFGFVEGDGHMAYLRVCLTLRMLHLRSLIVGYDASSIALETVLLLVGCI